MNLTSLCIKRVPLILKATNIICCPCPIVRNIITGALQIIDQHKGSFYSFRAYNFFYIIGHTLNI